MTPSSSHLRSVAIYLQGNTSNNLNNDVGPLDWRGPMRERVYMSINIEMEDRCIVAVDRNEASLEEVEMKIHKKYIREESALPVGSTSC